MEPKTIKVACECEGKKSIKGLMAGISEAAERLQQLTEAPLTDFLGRSFFHTKLCGGCQGKGSVPLPNGPDDFEVVECGLCKGTSRVVADN